MKTENIAFEGHCAFAVSTNKLDVTGGNHELVIDGTIYLFSNPVARFLFKVMPGRLEKANQNWNNQTVVA
ncbi:hypothetical protein [Marinoscillum sp. MHG1-6]|uniref:hypothetical protein n=1 Tax=Marinoscillum sp. MHG1-6 TaxID=2959627 RepID=UPI0021583C72|nr:hypothetical protein [Marinoscillum sp. MHG1-6]